MFRGKFATALLVFFFGIIALFYPNCSFAASNFVTDYHVTYTIDENGIAHAVVNGTLTNTTSQYFASSYSIQLGFDTITNVDAHDAGGPITPQVTKNGDGYVIALNFNKQAVGLGSKQQFVITFDTPTIAHHYGRIWEIDIPGISNPEDFSTFTVELKTPSSFGTPAYIKPKQAGDTLIFDKQTLGRSGISLAFGDTQVYNFHLAYHLRNPNLYPITITIALPPSTNYQEVSINNIDPQPNNVIEDKDGNWLAQYSLSSVQNMDVLVKGNAIIRLDPKQNPMSPEALSDYIKQQPYWEVYNATIQQLASQLQTPQAIYNYVSNKLHYDFSRVTSNQPRLGAFIALQHAHSAVCREFTDLFIALARAAHIPAREIEGFAYTDNPKQRPLSQEKEILHVWPEYYDSQKKMWIMVDPTWGSTTGGVDYFNQLDFDHFAFVIKGENSTYPIPAGGYNFTNDPIAKDVQIGFSTAISQETPSFVLDSSLPKEIPAGLSIQGSVIIKNTGSVYVPGQIIYLSSSTFVPHAQTLQTAGVPPFGSLVVPISFNRMNPLTNMEGNYTIRVAGISITRHVQSKVFFLTSLGGGIAIGILTLIIFIFTIKSRGLRLFR
ncbi:MAG TPA: transglutaminase-like domain-containing protein [Candidatus Sulfotelmatobacter sp.]|jgi:transglutaminase-like putative cysteine protease|nr:transglutaminase-like domain-containing protein [Candidatus Sulfotelmatobacter sp.]